MVVRTCGHEQLLFREWEGLCDSHLGYFNGLIKTIKERERQEEGCIKKKKK